MTRRTTYLLIAFALLPLAIEALRLGFPAATGTDMARHASQALPIGLHLAGALLFPTLGALQIAGWFRCWHMRFHRRAGRLLVWLGAGIGISALWLNAIHPPAEGPVKAVAVALVAAFFLSALALGLSAARRGDIPAHRAWMLRAYALAIAPAVQLVLGVLLLASLGEVPDWLAISAHFAGWAIPLVLAERAIGTHRRLWFIGDEA